jgi:hypothetical protein
MELLLQVDHKGDTPLHIAAEWDNTLVAEAICDAAFMHQLAAV